MGDISVEVSFSDARSCESSWMRRFPDDVAFVGFVLVDVVVEEGGERRLLVLGLLEDMRSKKLDLIARSG
jgi:hypothetical protein